MNSYFNYIVPIFNKEDILPDTLEGIEKCSSHKNKIILVVDGCTDRSEQIVDEYIKNSSHEVEKIIMPNVHMLLSVNAGLKKVTGGFTIVMQDDIVLQDEHMEHKIVELYEANENLGVISFRYGSDIRKNNFFRTLLDTWSISPMIEEYNFIKGPSDYANYPEGEFDKFYPKMSAINGPNCIPWNLLSELKSLDKNLAPYGFDDPEFCIRAMKLGYTNGLFPIRYKSDEEWGGTRRSKSFIREANRIHIRNKKYIWKKHEEFLKNFLKKSG